jgi:hypothetical protein
MFLQLVRRRGINYRSVQVAIKVLPHGLEQITFRDRSRVTWSVNSRPMCVCSRPDHLSAMALVCCGQPLAHVPTSSVCMSAAHSRNVCQQRWECLPLPPQRSVCKVVGGFRLVDSVKIACLCFVSNISIQCDFQVKDMAENIRHSFIWRLIDWLICDC